MTKYKLVDDNDKEVNVGYYLGWAVDDDLEDCFFKCTLKEDKTGFIVEATKDTKTYLKRKNCSVKEWEKDATSYVHAYDALRSQPTVDSPMDLSIEIE